MKSELELELKWEKLKSNFLWGPRQNCSLQEDNDQCTYIFGGKEPGDSGTVFSDLYRKHVGMQEKYYSLLNISRF